MGKGDDLCFIITENISALIFPCMEYYVFSWHRIYKGKHNISQTYDFGEYFCFNFQFYLQNHKFDLCYVNICPCMLSIVFFFKSYG